LAAATPGRRSSWEPAPGHRDQADGDVRQVRADDERLLDPRRQRIQDLLDPLHDLVLTGRDVGVEVEPHLDDRDALPALGLDVVDVGDRTDRLLDGVGDRLLDVLDVGPGVLGPDRDDRQVDVGEEVDRHPPERGVTQDHDGEGRHQHGDGVADREEGQPHGGRP
jgi:hypothetical protein